VWPLLAKQAKDMILAKKYPARIGTRSPPWRVASAGLAGVWEFRHYSVNCLEKDGVLHRIAFPVVSEWCQEYVNIRVNRCL